MYFFPALFHTEDYARAIIKGIAPGIEEDILSQRVEDRMMRRKRLSQPKPPKYRALIDEAALHRQVGGPAMMKAHLNKVLSLMQEEKAGVQVKPYEVGAYGASDGNFSYQEFADTKLPAWYSWRASSVTYTWSDRTKSSDIVRRSIICVTEHSTRRTQRKG